MPISILLVEDEPVFRDAFARAILDAPDLQLAGVANDLAGGMALLDRGPADILLVDLGLPDGNGLVLIREVVGRWPNRCDVMVISIFADAQHVMAALEAGATGYLLKDSSPVDLAQQIRELHSGGSPISPVIARQLLTRLAPSPMTKTQVPDSAGVSLTERERMVLALAAKGHSYVRVAEIMGISVETVKTYVKKCYRKLQVNSKTEAIYEVREMGLELD